MTELERLKADYDAARAARNAAIVAYVTARDAAYVANKAYKAALAAQEQEQNND